NSIDLNILQCFFFFFFFSSRRRHTRSKRDWSSDVCSSDLTLKVIEVSPLLSDGDVNEIKTFINHKRNPVLKQSEIFDIQFDVQTITSEVAASHVFEKAQEFLTQQYAITETYMQSAIEREQFSSTYIGNGIS